MSDLPAEARAQVLLERAQLHLLAAQVRDGLHPAVAVLDRYGHEKPTPTPAPQEGDPS